MSFGGVERPSAHGQAAVGPSGDVAGPVTVTDRPDPRAWDSYVCAHPAATLYHQHCWRDIFAGAFGHRCHYLAATRAGQICGVLPLVEFRSLIFGRFAVSLPFVNHGGLLTSDEAAASALVAETLARQRARGWRHVELRHETRRCAQWPARSHKVAMRRPLETSAEALWTALDRKVRNQVRKAEKCGVAVTEGGRELVPDFYAVFARNMRDLGTPVYSRALFERATASLDARVFVARVDRTPVAASITLRWRGRVEVPWASSLRAHADKSPNMLLYLTMLQSAIEHGAAEFDFGRSTPNEGTFHFKTQWGARPTPLVWEYVGLTGAAPDVSPANPRYRAAIRLWQHLPVSVASLLGPPIVRHIP